MNVSSLYGIIGSFMLEKKSKVINLFSLLYVTLSCSQDLNTSPKDRVGFTLSPTSSHNYPTLLSTRSAVYLAVYLGLDEMLLRIAYRWKIYQNNESTEEKQTKPT